MPEVIEVEGFIHANQPYRTEYIDGQWSPWTEQDVVDLKARIMEHEAAAEYHKASSLRMGLPMLEARVASDMGVLTGTMVKCTPYRSSWGSMHRDMTGTTVRLETVRRSELDRGEKVSVAM